MANRQLQRLQTDLNWWRKLFSFRTENNIQPKYNKSLNYLKPIFLGHMWTHIRHTCLGYSCLGHTCQIVPAYTSPGHIFSHTSQCAQAHTIPGHPHNSGYVCTQGPGCICDLGLAGCARIPQAVQLNVSPGCTCSPGCEGLYSPRPHP